MIAIVIDVPRRVISVHGTLLHSSFYSNHDDKSVWVSRERYRLQDGFYCLSEPCTGYRKWRWTAVHSVQLPFNDMIFNKICFTFKLLNEISSYRYDYIKLSTSNETNTILPPQFANPFRRNDHLIGVIYQDKQWQVNDEMNSLSV